MSIKMTQSFSTAAHEQIIDTMIRLTRLSNSNRAIVAGGNVEETFVALHRRGFLRLTTAGISRAPFGQCSVGFVAGQNSLQALETAISEISPLLSPTATVAVLIDSRESGFGLKIREKLERAGFRIEAGVRCQQGFVLCAQRQKFCEIAKAA
jgi:hypothetical protein